MKSRRRFTDRPLHSVLLATLLCTPFSANAVALHPDNDPDAKRTGIAAPVESISVGNEALPAAPAADLPPVPWKDAGSEASPTPAEPEEKPAEKPVTEDAGGAPEGELLVLRVTSQGYLLSPGTSAYEISNVLYVSLSGLMEALLFQINVFDAEKRAQGWFLEEGNDFLLDLTAKKLVIRGREEELKPEDYRYLDNEIFIRSDALKQWFGIDFTLNYSQLKLDITSENKLTFEEQVEREERWKALRKVKPPERKTYPGQEIPYSWADFPSVTAQVGTGYTKSARIGTGAGDYFLQGSGDLLKMSSEFFISGNDRDSVEDARLRLYRYDEDGNVIPGMDLTEVQMGDITPARLNFLGGGGNERGFGFTNRKSDSIAAPDNIIIEGEVEPGWEVELYRNSEFLGFLNATQTRDGRYEFAGLSLDAGNNVFKIVKYGPNGEKVNDYRRFFLGDGMLKPGRFDYDFSLSQPDRQVIPMDGNFNVGGSARMVSSLEYGVTPDFSLGGGAYAGPVFQERKEGALLSSRASLFGVFNRIDQLYTTDDASITTLSQRATVEDFNLGSYFAYNRGFDSADSDRKLFGSFNVSRQVSIFEHDLSLRVGAEHEIFQTDRKTSRLNQQISTTILNSSVSNRLEWAREYNGNTHTDRLDGTFFFRRRMDDFLLGSKDGILFRADFDYSLQPSPLLHSLTLTAERNLTDDLRLRTSSIEEFESQRRSYGATLSYDQDYYSLQLDGKVDSQMDYAVGFSVRFHLARAPRGEWPELRPLREAQRGTVTARVFKDNDENGTFSDGDEPLPQIRVSTQDGFQATSNEKGEAVISELTSYRRAQMTLDQGTLPDIFLISAKEGVSFVPRPASRAYVDFPVTVGGEIDGTLRVGENADASGIAMQLMNEKGESVQETKTDGSGYYLFSKVRPGAYTVAVAEASVKERGIRGGELKREVRLTSEEPMVNDFDFTVTLPAAAQAEEAAQPVSLRVDDANAQGNAPAGGGAEAPAASTVQP